jgi:hypothetical protein
MVVHVYRDDKPVARSSRFLNKAQKDIEKLKAETRAKFQKIKDIIDE